MSDELPPITMTEISLLEDNAKRRIKEIKAMAYFHVADWLKQRAWDLQSVELLDAANDIIDGKHLTPHTPTADHHSDDESTGHHTESS